MNINDSNDIVEETFKNVVDIDIEIVLGKLSNELKALFMGSTYTDKGVMVEASNDAQQEFAVIVVLSQMGTTNGTLNYVFYRTKMTLEGIEAETKTDSITDSQVTLSGKAIRPFANGIAFPDKVTCESVIESVFVSASTPSRVNLVR